jgi:hypothetical protein
MDERANKRKKEKKGKTENNEWGKKCVIHHVSEGV